MKGAVYQVIGDELGRRGIFLVELDVRPGNRILVTIDSLQGVTVEDCADISRLIEQGIDRKAEDYELQVSSPGLDQPFRVLQQYIKNIGREVEILTKEGKKKRGMLLSATEDKIEIETKTMVAEEGKKKKTPVLIKEKIELSGIKSTKAVISFK